jgi:hypothetical protein
MPDVNVTIRGSKIFVDKDPVQASVSKGERVRWTSTDGPFEIAFKPGYNWPHPPAVRQSGGSWQTECGPFNQPNTKLRYNVAAAGCDTLDPDLDVLP